jgi:hypothetical protein
MIDQIIKQSNIERNTALAIWDTYRRPEAEKGARLRVPHPARFDDIKEEYSFRLKEYAVIPVEFVSVKLSISEYLGLGTPYGRTSAYISNIYKCNTHISINI